jgi:hypothetical protein
MLAGRLFTSVLDQNLIFHKYSNNITLPCNFIIVNREQRLFISTTDRSAMLLAFDLISLWSLAVGFKFNRRYSLGGCGVGIMVPNKLLERLSPRPIIAGQSRIYVAESPRIHDRFIGP